MGAATQAEATQAEATQAEATEAEAIARNSDKLKANRCYARYNRITRHFLSTSAFLPRRR